MRTPKRAPAAHLLAQPVEDWLRERSPRSYRRLSMDLLDATNGAVDVSDRTIATWLGESVAAPPVRAAS